MNKVIQDENLKDRNNSAPKEKNVSPHAKMKMAEGNHLREDKTASPDSHSDEWKELEDFKRSCLSSLKSKRKLFIKPNIPKEWIDHLKMILAKIQPK